MPALSYKRIMRGRKPHLQFATKYSPNGVHENCDVEPRRNSGKCFVASPFIQKHKKKKNTGGYKSNEERR